MPRIAPRLIAAASCLLILAACQTLGIGEPGSAFPPPPVVRVEPPRPVATGLGIILGGWADNEIDTGMNEEDRAKNRQAEKRAYTAPIGQQITWNNPGNGNSGTITATKDAYDRTGVYCREFQQTVTLAGHKQQGYGKACQQVDGGWKIL